MSTPSRRVRRKKQEVPVPATPTPQRSKAEERMIKAMTQNGGKRFRVLRSAETSLKSYRRQAQPLATRKG